MRKNIENGVKGVGSKERTAETQNFKNKTHPIKGYNSDFLLYCFSTILWSHSTIIVVPYSYDIRDYKSLRTIEWDNEMMEY
jgi:hypothetical protein